MTDQELADALRSHPDLETFRRKNSAHWWGVWVMALLEDHPPLPEMGPGIRCMHHNNFEVEIVGWHAGEWVVAMPSGSLFHARPSELTPIEETP